MEEKDVGDNNKVSSLGGLECDKIVIGTMLCPLNEEKGTTQHGTLVTTDCEANDVALKLDRELVCQEEWNEKVELVSEEEETNDDLVMVVGLEEAKEFVISSSMGIEKVEYVVDSKVEGCLWEEDLIDL